jgi:hypothetical protein
VEEEQLPLETVPRRLMKTQQTAKTQVCALVNCRERERECVCVGGGGVQ